MYVLETTFPNTNSIKKHRWDFRATFTPCKIKILPNIAIMIIDYLDAFYMRAGTE